MIMGCTLRNVLAFAGVCGGGPGLSYARALRVIVTFLDPLVAAIGRITGERDILASGLACHRVLRAQRRHLPELSGTRDWLAKKGLENVAFGVTASVLTAYYVAAHNGGSVASIANGLEKCCRTAERILRHWKMETVEQAAEQVAIVDAEARALARACAACAGAALEAKRQSLSNVDALRLQFETMRAAAWPAGECCSAETHEQLCAKIASGVPLNGGQAVAMPVRCVPLSAIPSSVWTNERGSEASDGSQSTASSHTTSYTSTCSSASTSASTGSEACSTEMDLDVRTGLDPAFLDMFTRA